MFGAAGTRPFNRLRVLLNRNLTAANALDCACAAHPDLPLFHLDAPLPYRQLPGPHITCRQLIAWVNRLGNVLQAAGLQKYGRVAIYKSPSADYFFLALAIIKAGGIAVPVNPGMALANLRDYLACTGSNLLLTDAVWFAERIHDPRYLPAVQTWLFPDSPDGFPAPQVSLNKAMETASEQLRPAHLDSDSDVLIAHTSGTTGCPKGAISTSGSLIRGVKDHYKVEPISTRNRIALAAPLNHLVSYVGLYASMLAGLPVWPIGRFQPEETLSLIEREKITIFFAFPDVYLRLYEEGLEKYDLSSVGVWIATADASHGFHKQAFCRRGVLARLFGRPLLRSVFLDVLGTTEVGFGALSQLTFSFSRPRRDRCVGRPSWLAGPWVKIADENGRRKPSGEVGRIMVRGRTLFKGYWNAHDRLHGVMHDGWWWTGDVGYRDSLGRFYQLDRAVDIIPTRDGLVYTLPVEDLLLSHPDVSEAVVFSVPHPHEGSVPFALVCPRQGACLDVEGCRAWANAQLVRPIALRGLALVPLADLPRGLTGKVLKRILRERYARWFAERESAALVPPSPAEVVPGT